jgi:Domain of unknown function DUF21.
VTAVFIITAVVLIVVGGLLTALDGALHVLSRNDLLDEAENGKRRPALQSLATDVAAHVTALAFVRVIVDTLAAVLITLAISRLMDQWWQVLLIASIVLIAVFCGGGLVNVPK